MDYMGKRSYGFVKILDDYGANLNPMIHSYDGDAPYVMDAIKQDEVGIVLLLLRDWVDLEALDREGYAPLATALRHKSLRVACEIVRLKQSESKPLGMSPDELDAELRRLDVFFEDSEEGRYWISQLRMLIGQGN